MSVLTAIFAFSPARAAAQQDACPTNTTTPETVYEQAVSINTFVQTSTTFNPIPEVAVTITDAPTNLDGITTFHWSSTSMNTTSTSQYSTSSMMVQTPAPSLNALSCFASRAQILDKPIDGDSGANVRLALFGWRPMVSRLATARTARSTPSPTGLLPRLSTGLRTHHLVWATRCLRPARFPEPLRQLFRLEAMAC